MSVTKTLKENTTISTPNDYSSWKLTFPDTTKKVSDEDFTFDGFGTIATVVSSTSRLKNKCKVTIKLQTKLNGVLIGKTHYDTTHSLTYSSEAGTYKPFNLGNADVARTATLHAYNLWNANNPTVKNITTTSTNESTFLRSWIPVSGGTKRDSSVTDTSAFAVGSYTFSFNFPPVVETPTVTKDTTKWLKGLTQIFVSVPITYDADATTNTGTAQYGGYVTSIKLEVGSQSNVYTFTEATKPTTTQVIPLYLNAVGTFTPKVTVTDSRGLSTTVSLAEIEVLDYEKPSVNMTAVRCDEDGKIDDDGHNALVTATINYTQDEVDLTEPSIDVEDSEQTSVTSTTAWYTTYTSGSGVSNPISDWTTVNDGNTVYGVIDCDFDQSGALSWTDSYNITMLVEDTEGGTSASVVQRIPISYYTIDVKARGKEIAFGAPANDDLTNYPNGLFKCGMEAQFNEEVRTQANKAFIDGTIDPTQTPTDYIIDRLQIIDANGDRVASFHAEQTPSTDKTGAGFNANRIVNGTNIINGMMFHIDSNGTRTVYLNYPQAFRDALGIVDYVVEEGTSTDGRSRWRKWNSGRAEFWHHYNVSGVTTAVWTAPIYYMDTSTFSSIWNGVFNGSPFSVHCDSNSSQFISVTAYAWNSSGITSLRYLSVGAKSNNNVPTSIYAVGTWK